MYFLYRSNAEDGEQTFNSEARGYLAVVYLRIFNSLIGFCLASQIVMMLIKVSNSLYTSK